MRISNTNHPLWLSQDESTAGCTTTSISRYCLTYRFVLYRHAFHCRSCVVCESCGSLRFCIVCVVCVGRIVCVVSVLCVVSVDAWSFKPLPEASRNQSAKAQCCQEEVDHCAAARSGRRHAGVAAEYVDEGCVDQHHVPRAQPQHATVSSMSQH